MADFQNFATLLLGGTTIFTAIMVVISALIVVLNRGVEESPKQMVWIRLTFGVVILQTILYMLTVYACTL